jgi:four helix bundle protein
MGTIKRFYDLEAWKKARILNLEVYKMTMTEIFKRDFALIDQTRKASISIMANLAEGFGRKGNREFLQFLSISEGSLSELQSHLFVALDIEYIDKSKFDFLFEKTEETQRVINGLAEYLKGSELKGVKYKIS